MMHKMTLIDGGRPAKKSETTRAGILTSLRPIHWGAAAAVAALILLFVPYGPAVFSVILWACLLGRAMFGRRAGAGPFFLGAAFAITAAAAAFFRFLVVSHGHSFAEHVTDWNAESAISGFRAAAVAWILWSVAVYGFGYIHQRKKTNLRAI
jgi:hypothetical protein